MISIPLWEVALAVGALVVSVIANAVVGQMSKVEKHIRVTVNVTKGEEGLYEAEVVELGVPSFGRTPREATSNAMAAARLYLQTLAELRSES